MLIKFVQSNIDKVLLAHFKDTISEVVYNTEERKGNQLLI